jgi:very-short-patch-repair endonuclease
LLGQTRNGGRWGYILDAFHEGARLCVEVDGGVHRRRRGRDRRRDTRLRTLGIRTLRIPNARVMGELQAVVDEIRGLL